MREIILEELLEAGCHFGHQVTRSNPKARDFIFEVRDNIHIIDLAKTKQGLEEAAVFIKDLASKGGSLIIVGTKRQAKAIVEDAFRRTKDKEAADYLFYITNRWVGGLLTNFQEVSKNFKKYHDLLTDLQDDELKARYTKKEIGGWDKERQKLENLYGGVASITKLPSALFIVDSHLEDLAVREAIATSVPTVAIVDTNADPSDIDYPIPANDDAVGSIKLIVNYIIDAWIEGREQVQSEKKQETNDKQQKISEKKEPKINSKELASLKLERSGQVKSKK